MEAAKKNSVADKKQRDPKLEEQIEKVYDAAANSSE